MHTILWINFLLSLSNTSKFLKMLLKMPGYTRKENSQWLYSAKAIELIRNYMTKCPNLFERLAQNVTNDIFQEEELFDKGYIVYFITCTLYYQNLYIIHDIVDQTS